MAKYNVICKGCGKEYNIELFGKNSKRLYQLGISSWDELPVEHGLCSDCIQKGRDEENKQAMKKNKAAGLPQLEGSEKQIAWAESLRKGKIERLNCLIEDFKDVGREKFQRKVEMARKNLVKIKEETIASRIINIGERGLDEDW